MKKHRTALDRLEEALREQELLGEQERSALALLRQTAANLREINLDPAAPLPAPKELQSMPGGLAVYTDGACRGNPGPGAWACLAQTADGRLLFEEVGSENPTTNNRMEIQGAIQGLKLLERHRLANPFESFEPLFLYSDSKYVVEGMNQWIPGWKARGWKKADQKPPENLELWQELDEMKAKFPGLRAAWVKGHSGHPQNERCDQLANRMLDEEGH